MRLGLFFYCGKSLHRHCCCRSGGCYGGIYEENVIHTYITCCRLVRTRLAVIGIHSIVAIGYANRCAACKGYLASRVYAVVIALEVMRATVDSNGSL